MKYGCIYKISYKDLNYYGSSLKKDRFTKHKNAYKSWKEGKGHYSSSYQLFQEAEKNNELPTFEVLGCFYKYFCDECMRKEEQTYIDNYPCINKRNSFITEEQRKENDKEQTKEYREKNKEQIKEHKREYREENKEQIKEYYEKNKEKRKEYQKQYRLNKKDN